MQAAHLRVERRGETAVAWIGRPGALSVLDGATMAGLRETFFEIRGDPSIRGVILTGAGERAFAAGADIAEMAALGPEEARAFSLRGQHVLRIIETLGKPVIAAVNGFALGGGCELALACTVRILSEKAVLGLPELRLGIIPGYGGTQRLARLVGMGRAAEILLTGRRIASEEALRIGLAQRVVPAEELLPACETFLAEVYEGAPLAVRYALEAMHGGSDMTLDEGSALEASLFGLICGTEDAKEGCRAFLEKRKPEFRGR